MTDAEKQAKILALAQSIYLAKNNKYNDVEGEEETEFVNQTVDWVNQYIEELEEEADWNYVRENNYLFGTATAGVYTVALPATVNRLVVSPYRFLTLSQDGTVIAKFKVVKPNQLLDEGDTEVMDRVTVVGRKIVFSRELTDEEAGAEVRADVVNFIPRMSNTEGSANIEMLDLVKPKQLIILGVAKNATLPDIVQGTISPSLTQKYTDLLNKAVGENNSTSEVDIVPREDFSFIGGVF